MERASSAECTTGTTGSARGLIEYSNEEVLRKFSSWIHALEDAVFVAVLRVSRQWDPQQPVP